ncbi:MULTISPECIES: Fic/DOC family N-terminal domain-containing protein [Methylomonas]|uniref:Fic/DOC family N-terminal domain-containing protein n=1 Tax=Methylomonas TaxID=416 RepID=UPI0018D7C32E
MYSDYIPNIELFIRMYVLKESTQSSRIEGTQTNMEDALLEQENVAPDKRDDWEEVQNYVKAMNQAIENLQTLPFSARLIRLLPIFTPTLSSPAAYLKYHKLPWKSPALR